MSASKQHPEKSAGNPCAHASSPLPNVKTSAPNARDRTPTNASCCEKKFDARAQALRANLLRRKTLQRTITEKQTQSPGENPPTNGRLEPSLERNPNTQPKQKDT